MAGEAGCGLAVRGSVLRATAWPGRAWQGMASPGKEKQMKKITVAKLIKLFEDHELKQVCPFQKCITQKTCPYYAEIGIGPRAPCVHFCWVSDVCMSDDVDDLIEQITIEYRKLTDEEQGKPKKGKNGKATYCTRDRSSPGPRGQHDRRGRSACPMVQGSQHTMPTHGRSRGNVASSQRERK